jgi:hypothetical protein
VEIVDRDNPDLDRQSCDRRWTNQSTMARPWRGAGSGEQGEGERGEPLEKPDHRETA